MSVNLDILKERNSGTFNPDDVTCQVFGKEGMARRRLARKQTVGLPFLSYVTC